jgi:hypothetical protein
MDHGDLGRTKQRGGGVVCIAKGACSENCNQHFCCTIDQVPTLTNRSEFSFQEGSLISETHVGQCKIARSELPSATFDEAAAFLGQQLRKAHAPRNIEWADIWAQTSKLREGGMRSSSVVCSRISRALFPIYKTQISWVGTHLHVSRADGWTAVLSRH